MIGFVTIGSVGNSFVRKIPCLFPYDYTFLYSLILMLRFYMKDILERNI